MMYCYHIPHQLTQFLADVLADKHWSTRDIAKSGFFTNSGSFFPQGKESAF